MSALTPSQQKALEWLAEARRPGGWRCWFGDRLCDVSVVSLRALRRRGLAEMQPNDDWRLTKAGLALFVPQQAGIKP